MPVPNLRVENLNGVRVDHFLQETNPTRTVSQECHRALAEQPPRDAFVVTPSSKPTEYARLWFMSGQQEPTVARLQVRKEGGVPSFSLMDGEDHRTFRSIPELLHAIRDDEASAPGALQQDQGSVGASAPIQSRYKATKDFPATWSNEGCCPISLATVGEIKVPVFAVSASGAGTVFEQDEIVRWLATSRTNPATRERLTVDQLYSFTPEQLAQVNKLFPIKSSDDLEESPAKQALFAIEQAAKNVQSAVAQAHAAVQDARDATAGKTDPKALSTLNYIMAVAKTIEQSSETIASALKTALGAVNDGTVTAKATQMAVSAEDAAWRQVDVLNKAMKLLDR